MDDCGTGDSAPSADCSSAPDTSTHCSSAVDTPPDYTTCVSHPETGSSNHDSGATETTHHSHQSHPIPEDGASENQDDSHVPLSNPYNSEPSDNSPYMTDRPTTSQRNVYGRKTIVLKRTVAQNSARKRKLIIGMCLGLLIGAIIPIVVFIIMAN